MSKKTVSSSPRVSCERYKKHIRAYSVKCNNKLCVFKNTIPVTEENTCNRNKSLSAGILVNSSVAKPKKTTKSDLICNQNHVPKVKVVNCDKNCGDTLDAIPNCNISKLSTHPHGTTTSSNPAIFTKNEKKSLKQFYKNVNFQQSTESMHSANCVRTCNLNPIKEQQETDSTSESYSFLEIQSDSEQEEAGFMDPNDDENIRDLKHFREDNYFECHSVKSRVESKGGVTSSNKHKCVYRFYLNDRLFPVPLNTDYNKNIRCIECHLPLQDTDYNSDSTNIKCTIQAKVKLNNKVQDMMLILPVTKSFIVRERRVKLDNKKDDDLVYFGIIKLNIDGDSVFNRNMPSNSLALKYQKGYKEYVNHDKYTYESLDKDDIIII